MTQLSARDLILSKSLSVSARRALKTGKRRGSKARTSGDLLSDIRRDIHNLKSAIETISKHLKIDNPLLKPTEKSFYETQDWLALRYKVMRNHCQKHGNKCLACGARDVVLQVDHIKPRSKYPHLAIVESNLQVLCKDCNLGKSNTDETDWRAIDKEHD